ncbi:MAG: hypothetical protein WCR56_02325 [Bacilli bacterium]
MNKKIGFFLVSFLLIEGLCSCSQNSTSSPVEEEKKAFSVDFKNGEVNYHVNLGGSGKYDIYSSSDKDNNFKLIEEDHNGEYQTTDYISYFLFKDHNDSSLQTESYSYLYSTFNSDDVRIFTPEDDSQDIQKEIDDLYTRRIWDEFSPERTQFLFMPGTYNEVTAKVGYYTTCNGLGYLPDDVQLKSFKRDDSYLTNTALCNFWCGVENFSTLESSSFYVSQATYLRRMHIKGNLSLSDGGYSSGGFLADSKIDGTILNSTQQQWLTRNTQFKSWAGNVDINMVYSGVQGTVSQTWPNKRTTIIQETKLIQEKPFLVFDEDNGFGVFVPSVLEDSISYSYEDEVGTFIPITDFYIANKDSDTSSTLNAQLKKGKNLLFTPGIYNLDSPLEVSQANTILYGMGYATLRSSETNTDAILKVDNVSGVKIADFLFEAGSLLKDMVIIGTDPSIDHSANPLLLSDFFFRIGGSLDRNTGCETALTINSSNVIGDNFWLWRADHGMNRDILEPFVNGDGSLPRNIDSLTNRSLWRSYGVGWLNHDKSNYASNGLIVNGKEASIYGLMVEHFGKTQTIWNGEDGYLVFYQSEIPYDTPDQTSWTDEEKDDGENEGYASYQVSDHVINHMAYGLGVYYVHKATTEKIVLDHAIYAPSNEGINIIHMSIANFKSNDGCGIRHIINEYGEGNIKPYTNQKTSLTSFIAGKVTN